ncbi:MAG: HD domain-containing phosphohydrolase [Bacteriovorax sp.]|nr:HD domain-containing phosphohydrolase [Bacteriovorax sp.]
MKTEYDFFIIERDHLKGKNIFPFQLYIFNPIHKKYSMFLNGNRPLTKELESFLDFLLDKGGKIAILKKQRRTFLTEQSFHESEIPSLKARELHELEKERIMNLKLKEMYDEKNGVFAFQSEFEKACDTDNFEKIIEYARVEIITFSVTQSHTISLAIHLTKTHLTSDNFLNRIVATSYLFAKTANILDPVALADIICGAFLSHIGFSQLPLTMLKTPLLSLGDKERKLFEKHTILSNHLIKTGQLDISERCKKIIIDHHERISGSGYPGMKYGDSIETFSLIVGIVAHLFEFSSGKINGSKQPIKSVIISMKNKTFSPGLEFDFGDKIYNSLVTLINTDKVKEKIAA